MGKFSCAFCKRVATSENAFNYTSQEVLNERKERKKLSYCFSTRSTGHDIHSLLCNWL